MCDNSQLANLANTIEHRWSRRLQLLKHTSSGGSPCDLRRFANYPGAILARLSLSICEQVARCHYADIDVRRLDILASDSDYDSTRIAWIERDSHAVSRMIEYLD